MRKVKTLREIVREAEENNNDLSDLAVDEDDIVDISEIDDDLEEDSDEEE